MKKKSPWTCLFKLSSKIFLLLGLFVATSSTATLLGQDSAPEERWELDSPQVSTEVDWLAQLKSGGLTMIALGFVSVAGCAFALERMLTIRQKNVCPRKLVQEAERYISMKDMEGLGRLAGRYPSTLGRIIQFTVEHRNNDFEKLTELAESIGTRELIDQEQRNFPLAVIATIAPLLGLLGTMIGMIEAFQLVSIYGDEGGASMLAGSIAKALITTAVGLILAIPAVCAFHYFKHRLHKLSVLLDQSVEHIITGLFFKKSGAIESEPSGTVGEEQVA